MDELENAVAGALVSAEARDLAADYAEIGIDAALEEGLVREIPVIRTIYGLTKVGIAIRDRLFAQKLLELINCFDDTDPEQRRQLIERLESDPKYGRRVGEHLTDLLDRIEVHRKPRMIGAVFLAYLKGAIDGTMLNRLNRAVELVPIHELPTLRAFCEADEQVRGGSFGALQALSTAGLLDAASAWGGLVFRPNEISEAFLKLNLDRLE